MGWTMRPAHLLANLAGVFVKRSDYLEPFRRKPRIPYDGPAQPAYAHQGNAPHVRSNPSTFRSSSWR